MKLWHWILIAVAVAWWRRRDLARVLPGFNEETTLNLDG